MIDFGKIEIPSAYLKELLTRLEVNGWKTTGTFDRDTGEVAEYPFEAENGKLKILFKSVNYIQLQGSFHKFSQDGENFEDYSYADFLDLIIFLSDTLGINPFTCPIHHLEFGVNISLPFEAESLISRILNYKGTNFHPMAKQQGISLGIVCERSQLNIKIYSKKLQYDLEEELMRVEDKVFKMQYLRPCGIYFLIDLLNPFAWQGFSILLSEMFAELIITDDSFDVNELPPEEKELMNNWSNPKYLESQIERDRKVFEQQRRKFREIILSRSTEHQQQKVVDLIKQKSNQLFLVDDDTISKFTDFIKRFEGSYNYQFYHSINRENWYSTSTAPPPLPEMLKGGGRRKKDFPSKKTERQNWQDGKIGKRVFNQAPVQKSVKKEIEKRAPAPGKFSELKERIIPPNWDNLISELTRFYETATLPITPVQLNLSDTITDPRKFISSHMATIINNKGKGTFEPYLERLIQFKWILLISDKSDSPCENLHL